MERACLSASGELIVSNFLQLATIADKVVAREARMRRSTTIKSAEISKSAAHFELRMCHGAFY